MKLDLTELLTVDGTAKDYEVPLDMKTFLPRGSKTGYPVICDHEIRLHCLHKTKREVEITLEIDLSLQIPCDRCLAPVNYPFLFTETETVDCNADEASRIVDLNEQPFIDGTTLDVDRLVYNELMLYLPAKVLCREDCKGLCPVCGADRNRVSCDCEAKKEGTLSDQLSGFRNLLPED
ncbi:MAG: DUF177 domain-containing protein [Lachnospiraceae bacterium]|nr:DUF177 domain-containing protein [Lachnospiraceae bacterium]